jgi:hypothetical protein
MFVGEPLSIEGAQVLSGYVHLAVLAVLALVSSRLPDDEPDAESIADRIALMRAMLEASGERERMRIEPPEIGFDPAAGQGGDGRAVGEEGSSGSSVSKARGGHASVLGRSSSPSVSRDAALREAASFGMIGTLAPLDAPGRAQWTEGTITSTTLAPLWGGTLEDSFAWGGLGLSGTGEGSGGRGEGISIGMIGSLGHGRSEGSGGTGGWGFLGGHHISRPTVCGCDEAAVNGRLPPETIQRVVRQNMGRFRYCYERALDHNPGLQGRVVTKFLIARDGSVAFAADDPAESNFPDPGVVSCIVRAFGALSFPDPEGGTVTVVYPLSLSPSG